MIDSHCFVFLLTVSYTQAIELQSGIEEQKQTITSLSQQLRGVRAKLHAVRTSQGQRIADLEVGNA